MFQRGRAGSAALPADLDSLKNQRVIFTILNLFLLLVLLLLHASFASFWGRPSAVLTSLLGTCFAVRTLELLVIRGRVIRPPASAALTAASIALNLVLAVVLASVIDREDSQYSALLIVPIVEAAFRFGFAPALAVATAADSIAFYWVWRYANLHPPFKIGEYFEAGTQSIVFFIVAILVSVLVRQLRRKQGQLAGNIRELEITRERLLQEEKLAAVGRLSSAVAHEIRNPAAMISSSLATAKVLTGPEREEMFEIANREASRLVSLTNDLLAYGRPRRPALAPGIVRETVASVVDACRARAHEKSVSLQVHAPQPIVADYDQALVEQANEPGDQCGGCVAARSRGLAGCR